jgi:hypothetical protein
VSIFFSFHIQVAISPSGEKTANLVEAGKVRRIAETKNIAPEALAISSHE